MKAMRVVRTAGGYCFWVVLVALCLAGGVWAQQIKTTTVNVTRNTLVPEIYSDEINLQFLLVNSPGAKEKGTTFSGAYTMYFMPEGEIENLALSRGGRIDKLLEGDILNKTLLGRGDFKLDSPGTGRVYEKTGILFKSKVAEDARKMLGKITIFYTVKIYDSKLAKTIYKDGSFSYAVYDRTDTKTARKTFNVNFFVTETGEVYGSSLPRDKADTSW